MQHSKFEIISLVQFKWWWWWLLLLYPSNFHLHCGMTQFVEFRTDYQHNNKNYNNNHQQADNLVMMMMMMDYNYGYHISHDASGVHVQHNEERQGDRVVGKYSLVEPDGHTIREVHYHVDGERGFRSIIRLRSRNSRVHRLFQLSRNQPAHAIAHAQPVAFIT